ncbi:Cdc15p [Rhizophagus irregularis DAOM 197198w]|uniref:Cdc15p n=2 Tax=Rhizophagus irregularis TaxID=588596 RepID=A0A015K9N1_RHIIW|nr:Cdc15p [Rhizophagus irregularis DAOM 197198w]
MEGVASGNPDIDRFIKNTIYDAKGRGYKFLEWVPYERFTDIKEIGEGGFAKVFSATWIDGVSKYDKQSDGSLKKREPKPGKLKIQWEVTKFEGLEFYGLTKDPETKEFMIIIQFAEGGNLRSSLSNNFKNILWKEKIELLYDSSLDLRDLHESGYLHKDFHSGNILRINTTLSLISDFGLSGPANEQKSDDKVYGVMPYIAPEVLNGEQYTSSADIYSFGVVMAEISSGKPPFYDKKHDLSLALAICNGLRPEFGKGTPEFYKKLAYKCMNANSNERPTAKELFDMIEFWFDSLESVRDEFGLAFEEADKEIPNISTLYKKNSDAVYTSRAFTFSNLLPKPINSSIITSYINEENNKDCDSQLVDLEVSNSIQLRDTTVDENSDDD